MSLILAWAVFPLVLAAVGAGWGTAVERVSGGRIAGVLIVPLGLAAALVVAALLTAWHVSAPAATPVVAVVAAAGLLFAWPGRRISGWPLGAAIAVLLAYGAPVLLSGQATFTGYIRLDDSATWLAITDHVMTHGRALSDLPPSTYRLLLQTDIGGAYPLGAFMLLGIGHALTGIDSAWIFQPYLALCGVAVGLSIYALVEPLVASPRLRALVAFLGAQPALLYGYSLWGGIKELTAAFLLALGATLAAQLLLGRPRRARALLPTAIAAAALIVTLGAGSAAWVVPALALVAIAWLRPWDGLRGWRPAAGSLGWLGAITATLSLPLWVVLGTFLGNDSGLFSSGESTAVKLGNLIKPLSAFQLAGIWPVGDFRLTAPTVASVLLIGTVLVAAVAAIALAAARRQLGLALYVAVGLAGCAIIYLAGSTPWVVGKALAVSSPALLAAGLAGAALLWQRHPAGVAALVVISGGVVWSNVLAYHDALLAPRARLAELQRLSGLVATRGPTFINEYEIYADRHFLRSGAPVEPAEYREPLLALRDGAVLTDSAFADLDSFPLSTLTAYRSLVVRRSPVSSRPPSSFRLIWDGRYYQLWQQPEQASERIVEHVPLGDSNTLPYCGRAQNGALLPLCSVAPVAVPACSEIVRIGRLARLARARLIAYQRPAPIVLRGDQLAWPSEWIHDPVDRTLTPTGPGEAIGHIDVLRAQRYELWLGGSFVRGFDARVDGHRVGRIKDQPSNIGGYVAVARLFLRPGRHAVALTYPHGDLTPASGDSEHYEGTVLNAVALEPLDDPPTGLLVAAPRRARSLCDRPLDWVEVVAPA